VGFSWIARPTRDRGRGGTRVIFLRPMSGQSRQSLNAGRKLTTGATLDTRFRLIGVLPLTFFVGQAFHYWRVGGAGNLFWMCNAGNLLLAAALFFNQRELIRAAAIWTIPGLAIWIRYVLFEYDFVVSSLLAHVGGIIVGLVVLRRVRMDRIAWVYAFFWYLLMQIISRVATDPLLNVNVAHRVQTGWESTFSSYWKFWLVLTLLVGFCMWAIGIIFSWIWPAGRTGSFQLGTRTSRPH
jgi:hypothetical protein